MDTIRALVLSGGGGRGGRHAVLRLQPSAIDAGGNGPGLDGKTRARNTDDQGIETLGLQLLAHPRVRRHGPDLFFR